MTTQIIPFDNSARLPAYLANRTTRTTSINHDLLPGAAFPTLSIKGKVFTLVKGSERKVMTRHDDPDEALQSLNIAVVRANSKSRVFYAKAFTEGESDGKPPTCFSSDGIAPSAAVSSENKQSKACANCPQNVWGVKDGKGTACSTNTRLAIVDPINPTEPWLLRVPPASRKGFADAVRMAETRGLDYNMMVLKVAFDKEAPSPKLTFKPVGLLDDAGYAAVNALFEDDTVKEIVGLAVQKPVEQHHEDSGDLDELDAAIAARGKPAPVVQEASAPAPVKKTKPAPAPVAEEAEEEAPAPAPVKKAKTPPAATPTPASEDDDLLGELDTLLSATDD